MTVDLLGGTKWVHIVAVGGTLMGAFAAFLKRQGVDVTGSDSALYPPMSDVLKQAGVSVSIPFSTANLERGGRVPDIVVIGNVVSRDNVEAKAAVDRKLNYTSLPEFMEKHFLGETRNLVVCGTHGKTTTSSLLSHVLKELKKDPSYFIGGVSLSLPTSFHVAPLKKGAYFVLEGDEYDTAFWDKVPKFNHYLPDDVILTSVEYDHADIYPTLEKLLQAFDGLADRIRPGGRAIVCRDFPLSQRAEDRIHARNAGIEVITYGSQNNAAKADFQVAHLRSEGMGSRFDVVKDGVPVAELTSSLCGNHNALNALAVWIECTSLGYSSEEINRALQSFRGVKRRQEIVATVRGIDVIDDFAHHPTAVRETLLALKKRYPGRRILAVFEPRSATSRRKVFQKDFAQALSLADKSYVAQPYDQTKISETDRFSSQDLISDIESLGGTSHIFEGTETGVKMVSDETRELDVVVIMSNGGFDGYIPKFTQALKQKFQ